MLIGRAVYDAPKSCFGLLPGNFVCSPYISGTTNKLRLQTFLTFYQYFIKKKIKQFIMVYVQLSRIIFKQKITLMKGNTNDKTIKFT